MRVSRKVSRTARPTAAPRGNVPPDPGVALSMRLRQLVAGSGPRITGLSVAVAALNSCNLTSPSGGNDPAFSDAPTGIYCSVKPEEIYTGGVGLDGIVSLVNPPLVPIDHPDARYMAEYAATVPSNPDAVEPRVVALLIDELELAVPLNILWWHEIVHLDVAGRRVAVTYCPLTGSSLAFDASSAPTRRFLVSGLLFQNNLIMADEETGSLWPQMCARAARGARQGTELTPIPVVEMSWEAWKARHPRGLIVGSRTQRPRDYAVYPYPSYERIDLVPFPLSRPLDRRRPPKERVFGVPRSEGGLALPFGILDKSQTAVAYETIGSQPIIILWDAAARAAAAFYPRTRDGQPVELRPHQRGFVDSSTGTIWDVEGRAIAGPLEGQRLVPYAQAHVAYWFAWAAFHPATRIWSAE